MKLCYILTILVFVAYGCSGDSGGSSKRNPTSSKKVYAFDELEEGEALSDSGDWEVLP